MSSPDPAQLVPGLDRWRELPAAQQPQWPDRAALDEVLGTLATVPPIVAPAEIDQLRAQLAEVASPLTASLSGLAVRGSSGQPDRGDPDGVGQVELLADAGGLVRAESFERGLLPALAGRPARLVLLDWARDAHVLERPKARALRAHVIEDVRVFLVVLQLLGDDHVQHKEDAVLRVVEIADGKDRLGNLGVEVVQSGNRRLTRLCTD